MNKLILAILAFVLVGIFQVRSMPAHAHVPAFNGDSTRKDAGALPGGKNDYSVEMVNAIRSARRGNRAPVPAPARHRLPQIVILNKGH